jgi:hypothetical protein
MFRYLPVHVVVFPPQDFFKRDLWPSLLIPQLAVSGTGDEQNDDRANQKTLHDYLTWLSVTVL